MTRFLSAAIAAFLWFGASAFALGQEIVPGCTNLGACNYSMEATIDDGTCAFAGCNDPAACNFNGLDVCAVDCLYPAIGGDCAGGHGLCGPGTFWNANAQRCEVTLSGDTDLNGCVSTTDLLDMLSMYGLCVDLEARTFACGVDHVTFDGHDYATVQIGEDCWFAENLRTTVYANGDSISAASDVSDWAEFVETQEPALCVLGYDSLEVIDLRGLWYNAYAAYDERGLCPTGWHVSTEEDWVRVELGLGGEDTLYWPQEGWFPNTLAKAVKSMELWNGTNTTGMNAIPAGSIVAFEHPDVGPVGTNAHTTSAFFWSTVEGADASAMLQRRRVNAIGYTVAQTVAAAGGMSVRCIRD
jgi:uncharacterized protein (TIGR02145 family)